MSGAGLPTADDVFGKSPDSGLPTADQVFGPDESVKSGPAQDSFFSTGTVSHVLNAFNQGAEAGWGDTPHVLSPDAEKFLQKSGTFNDYKNGRTSILKSANEALIRPAASALDVIMHPLATGSAVISGAEQAIKQTGVEAGQPQLGQAGAEVLEYETGRGDLPLRSFSPADFAKAKSLRVVGSGEAGYFGLKEPSAAEGLSAAVKQIGEEEAETPPHTGAPVTPEEQARAAGGVPPEAAVPDVHSVAREIAPDTFKDYDALSAEREAYRRQIQELSVARTETPEAQAAQAKVDDILGKVRGVEDRLTKSAAARLDDAREELDTALHRDTPDMQAIRQQILATDFKLRDLAPQVAQAYREAQSRLPQVEEAPAPVAEAAAQPEHRPPQIIPAAGEAQSPELAPANVVGGETLGTAPKQAINITSDVSQKLVDAGRPKEEADAAAAIVAAHYEARAARFEGKRGTAADLYLKDAPDIRGAGIRKRALEMAQGRTLHQEGAEAPTFYSALTRNVEGLNQAKASPEQWRGIIDNLKNKGVKQDEIEWSGVKDWLADHKGPVSKDQLQNFLRENEVNVQEVEKGGEGARADELRRLANTRGMTEAERAELISIEQRLGDNATGSTKFSQYTLPGGKNYRELLLTLPAKDTVTRERTKNPPGWGGGEAGDEGFVEHGNTGADFRSSHFDEPNVLAHVRFDDRTSPNGEKILHVAEVQSDWHQRGRREGYDVPVYSLHDSQGHVVATNRDRATLEEIRQARTQPDSYHIEDAPREFRNSVPNAPFKQSWQELSMKRMLRYAAEHGYDKLTWDTGETQNARYDLSKQIDDILYRKDADGEYYIGARKDGKRVLSEKYPASKLPDVVGKEVADKIINGHGEDYMVGGVQGKKLSGLDLKIGGEGMKGFYDKILPKFLDKYAKKWGAKVEASKIAADNEGWHITPPSQTVHGKWMVKSSDYNSVGLRFDTETEAKAALAEKLKTQEVHSIPITESMRESVMQGQPLFQGRRGSITLGEARNTIKLFKDADASTFMHETGHHWLEELMADAKDEAAPADLVKDAQTVRDWLGAKEGEAIKRAQHEKFARGFERYLMEGVAPSRQLASVFAKFRDWLTQIYQTVTRLRAPINEDIRGVFDRLLSANPERTVIAPEKSTEAHLADIHEHEAEHTPPERAEAVADHIRTEVNSVAKEKVPDVHRELPANETGGIAREDTGVPDRADAAGTERGAEGNAEASGAQPAGGDAIARKSVAREQFDAALEDVKRSRSRLPKLRNVLDEIRSNGGIKLTNAKGERIPEAGDILEALRDFQAPKGVKGFTKGDKTRLLNDESGVTPDYIREALAEDGWFGSNRSDAVHNTDINDLIDLIRRAAQEDDAFHPEDEAVYELQSRRSLDEELDHAGISSADSPEYAAHKLAAWRASQEAALYAHEQEMAAYEEMNRLEPDVTQGLELHGYEPGSDYEIADEYSGLEGGAGGAGEPEGPGHHAAISGEAGKQPGDNERPTGPNDRFTGPDSSLIDKAGNIVLDNLNTNDDVKAVLRQVAEDNDQFLSARRGVVSDADVLAYADAMGIESRDVNLLRLRAMSLEDGVPLAARIRVGREMLIQSAQAVHDAMKGTDELAYANAAQRHLMIQETLSAVTAEVGRGLRAFRSMGEDATKAQGLSEFLQQNTGRTLFQLQQEMKNGRRLDTPAKVSGFLRDVRKPSLGDMALEIFKNWLISGPITHMTYSIGNTALALWKAIPETFTEASVGALRGTEGADRVRFGEVGAQVYAMIRGQRNGFQAAWDALKAGQTMALPGEGESLPLLGEKASTPFTNTKAVPGVAGTIVRAPGERMVAPIHSYFRSIGYAQGIARQAYRVASNEGLRGDAFSRRVADLTTHPTEDMMRVARDEATEQTLMGRGGELTKNVRRLVNTEFHPFGMGRVQPIAFIDPFVHIQSNIVEQTVIERSFLAIGSKALRDDILGHNGEFAQNRAIARASAGTSLALVGAGLAAEGLLTPSEPSDPKEAAMWRRVHGMPHSLTLGDVSVDLSRLGVLGFGLGIAADIQHAAALAPNEDIYKTASLLVHSFTQNFLDEGFMRGPSDLIKALDDNERYGASWARNFVSTVAVPFSVGMSQVAKQVDPYAREARTTMDAIKAKVPWWSETLFPRRDIWGEPVPNREWLGTYTQAISHDPVDNALMEVGYYPSRVQRKIRGVQLTDHQYDDYARLAGRTAKMQLNTMVAMPGFGTLPVSVRQEMVKEAITTSRENARSLMMMQYPEIMQQAIQSKADALH